MRKVISLLLALAMILSLAACTSTTEEPVADEPTTLVYGSGDYTISFRLDAPNAALR